MPTKLIIIKILFIFTSILHNLRIYSLNGPISIPRLV